MDRLFAMMVVFLYWIGLACACGGLGFWVRRVWGRNSPNVPDVFRCIWIGLAVLVAWLQIVHLWVPVTGWVVMPVLLIGWIGFARFGRRAARAWGAEIAAHRYLWGGAGLLLLWVANRSIGATLNADIDFYHRATSMWVSQFAILRGFANVQLWFGYNQSAFLYAAGVDALPFPVSAEHVANSFLWGVGFLHMVWAMGRVAGAGHRAGEGGRASETLLAWAAFPVVLFLFGGHLTGYSPEMYLFLAVFLVAAELLDLWTDPAHVDVGGAGGRTGAGGMPESATQCGGEEACLSPDLFRLLVLVSVCCVAMTMKVSSIPFFGMAILSGVWAYGRRAESWRAESWRVFVRGGAVVAGVMLLILGVWMYRGVLTSGYPLFPATVSGFEVPWRVATDRVSGLGEYLTWSAREGFGIIPEQRIAGPVWQWDWLGSWFAFTIRDGWSWALGWLPLGGMLCVLSCHLVSRKHKRVSRIAGGEDPSIPDCSGATWVGVISIPVVAVVAWFLSGPRFLYLGSVLWAGCFLSMSLSGFPRHRWGGIVAKVAPAGLLVFCVVMIGVYTVRHPLRSFPVLYMDSTRGGFYALPAPERFALIEVDGVHLHCPLPVHDPTWNLTFWRGPAPLLPAKANSLSFRLRTHGRMEDGFLPDAPRAGLVPEEATGIY